MYFAAITDLITEQGRARVFIQTVFQIHGLTVNWSPIDTDGSWWRLRFWQSVFQIAWKLVEINTSDPPRIDDPTNRASRVPK